jgi:hypothetical protein
MALKPPWGMDPAEFIACARHWRECKGCPLCQPLRDKLKKEDQRAVALVNAEVASYLWQQWQQ